MWRALKWILILWALLLIICDFHIQTSLYKYEDNRVEVRLPRWQPLFPWARMIWHAGTWQWEWYGLDGPDRPMKAPPHH